MRAIPLSLRIVGLGALLAGACDTTDPCDAPPVLRPNISPLLVCGDTSGEEGFPVSVLIQNRGCDDLAISKAEIRWDSRGAFSEPELDATAGVIPPDGEGFVRTFYRPAAAGEDHVTLVLTSNDPATPSYRIPICGPGRREAEPDRAACEESTQCDDGLRCLAAGPAGTVVECGGEGAQGPCTCRPAVCDMVLNCCCPPAAVDAGECDPRDDPDFCSLGA